MAHLELVRDLHQLTVDAYAAQHAPRDAGGDLPPNSIAYALVGLHLALDRGLPVSKFAPLTSGWADPTGRDPGCPPRAQGAMTVFDVAATGTMASSVPGHATAVRAWAAAVWEAWAAEHARMAALTTAAGPVFVYGLERRAELRELQVIRMRAVLQVRLAARGDRLRGARAVMAALGPGR